MPSTQTNIVVVGAGFAGIAVAERLAASAAHITVVDRENYHLFQPLLYQVATAALSPADIAEPHMTHVAGLRQCRSRP